MKYRMYAGCNCGAAINWSSASGRWFQVQELPEHKPGCFGMGTLYPDKGGSSVNSDSRANSRVPAGAQGDIFTNLPVVAEAARLVVSNGVPQSHANHDLEKR